MNAKRLTFDLPDTNCGLKLEEALRLVDQCPVVAPRMLVAIETDKPLRLDTIESREVVEGIADLNTPSKAALNVQKALLEINGRETHD